MKRSQRRKERKKRLRRKIPVQVPAQPSINLQDPKIRIVGEPSESSFAKALHAAVESFRFDDLNHLTRLQKTVIGIIGSRGFECARAVLEEALTQSDIESPQAKRDEVLGNIMSRVGEQIYSSIPEAVRLEAIPYFHCDFAFEGNALVIKQQVLESQTLSDRKLVYHLPLLPNISIHGQTRELVFREHAIERIRERMKKEYISYGASGDVFAFFAKCVYFEPAKLYLDQEAIALWDFAITPGVQQYEVYVKQIMGERNINWTGGLPYYRLGYCPVEVIDGLAVAKTLLTPGYKKTPEFGLLLKNRRLSSAEKSRLIAQTEELTSADVVSDEEIEHIKWFHENGIPQVRQMTEEVFRYGERSIRMIDEWPMLVARRRQLIQQGCLPRTMIHDN